MPGKPHGPSVPNTPLYKKRRSKEAAAPVLQRRLGGPVRLAKPLSSGGLRRRKGVSPFWRSLAPGLSGTAQVPEQRLNLWLLVLTAKKIPHLFFPASGVPRIYVPPLQEGVAQYEIRAVEAERGLPAFTPPTRDNIPGVVTFLLLLLIWHGLYRQWFVFHLPVPPFPEGDANWSSLFGLDVYRTRALHEWWRAATALTLHTDNAHLFSNIGFGLVFFIPLCRRAGLGLGIALAVCGGIFGNVANAFYKEANVVSIGFSTALFAAVGCLCTLSASDVFGHISRHAEHWGAAQTFSASRKVLLPLATGLALLGLLGGGGEARTDYAAHIFGFGMGILTTLCALPLEKRIRSLPDATQRVVQAALFAAVPFFFALTWIYALLYG